MKLRNSLFLACFALNACFSNEAPTVLSPQGYGEVRFGSLLIEAETSLEQLSQPRERDDNCGMVTFAAYPNIRFMVESGVITRADAGEGIENSAGVLLGTAYPDVVSDNPDIQVLPHKYDPDGHYLLLSSADGLAALVFEESGGVITAARGGVKPSVEYVEGCL